VSGNWTNCIFCVKVMMNVIFVFRHLAVELKVPGIFRHLQ
jgi:hypothetical protein